MYGVLAPLRQKAIDQAVADEQYMCCTHSTCVVMGQVQSSSIIIPAHWKLEHAPQDTRACQVKHVFDTLHTLIAGC
jgi:cell division FtsZ-interacting protein ZapD